MEKFNEFNIIQTMNAHNETLHKYEKVCRAKNIANASSAIIHLLLQIPFLAKIVLLSGAIRNEPQLLKKIAGIIPFLDDNNIEIWLIAVFAVFYLILIPLLIGIISYSVARIVLSFSQPFVLGNTAEQAVATIQYRFNDKVKTLPSKFLFRVAAVFIATEAVPYSILFFNATKMGTMGVNNAVKQILLTVVALFGCIILPSLLACLIFYTFQHFFAAPKYSLLKKIDSAKYSIENAAEEIQEHKKEQSRIAKEQREEELRIKKAAEAEEQFLSISDPENEEAKVEELAKDGSLSAKTFLGKLLYSRFSTETLTNKEQIRLAAHIKEYLEPSIEAGDVESDYISSALSIVTEANSIYEWECYLNKMREMKASGLLPQKYHKELDSLIPGIISTINKLDETIENNKKEAEKEAKRNTEIEWSIKHAISEEMKKHKERDWDIAYHIDVTDM